MILEKLVICNFRSYYGRKEFEFSKHLNLILGANGDGKTTFFEAMNWVLTPDYAPESDEDRLLDEKSLVSAKMFKELKVGEQGRVLVSLLLRNNDNRDRIVEHAFNALKTDDGDMRIQNRSFKAYSLVGTRRKEMFSLRDLFEGENVFPVVIKKYHLFKGEDKLNIFNDKTTLQTLIDLFSDIKDIAPYKQFAKYALEASSSKINENKSKQDKQNSKIVGLQTDITGKDFSTISDEIDSLVQKNAEIEKAIADKKKQIARLEKQISDLYATSSSGENLKDYVNNIGVVNKWHKQKEEAAVEINRLLTNVIPNLKGEINKKRDGLAKNIKASGSSTLYRINEFFRLFADAVEETENDTYEEFLNRLAKEANKYLALLNVDDFIGIIKIYIDITGELKIELQDKSGQVLTNPNTSLLTTMHISILLAISELTKENRNAEYPLIFDAPTSSFDEGKDKTFYECLNTQVDKQCIVVTKSYLYKDDNGEYVVDREGLSRLNCKKYRIKKMTGFDKLDISTIDTEVEEIV